MSNLPTGSTPEDQDLPDEAIEQLPPLPGRPPDPIVAETLGLSPKVPIQAIVTVAAFVLAYFAIDIDTLLSGALAVLLGIGGGVKAPPGIVRPKPLKGEDLDVGRPDGPTSDTDAVGDELIE